MTRVAKVRFCEYCKKEFIDNYDNKKRFCNSKCRQNKNYVEYIGSWLNGDKNGMQGKHSISHYIRRWLLEQNNFKCQKCGWSEVNITTGKTPLTVNHIDGHYKNNLPANLELLCPNCHSLTTNYGSLNKGNGREGRVV